MILVENGRFSLVITQAIGENLSFSTKYSFVVINLVINGLSKKELKEDTTSYKLKRDANQEAFISR